MANFIVTYDLNGPHPSHKAMDDHIRSLSIRYARLLETVWWVEYSGTPVQLSDAVRRILREEDLLLVVEAKDAAWTRLLIDGNVLVEAWRAAA